VVREALTLQSLSALEPREAAAYFIVRRAEGFTATEEQLLADWLAKDEVHRRLFASADRAWQSFKEPEGDEILSAIRAHALAASPRGFSGWRVAAAAAAVLVLVGAGALYVLAGWNSWAPESGARGPATAAIQYTSQRGEVKEIELPDGSRMTLDADSAAVGDFGSGRRAAELQRGRAYFAVAKNQSPPFVVTAGGRSIVSVGTGFDVDLATDGLTITLLEGRVEVSSPDGALAPLKLEPGEQYFERARKATVRTLGAAAENAITWRAGLVDFDDRPLAEAATVMNRYSSDQIVIRDPEVAAMRVSGQFAARDTQRFADTVAESHKLRSTRRGNEIELARRE
jgi:transmembrane sensor